MAKTDEELKAQSEIDWIDHADTPYERYLELKINQLRAALKPFADMAGYVSTSMYTQSGYVGGLNTVQHYRDALQAMGESDGGAAAKESDTQ